MKGSRSRTCASFFSPLQSFLAIAVIILVISKCVAAADAPVSKPTPPAKPPAPVVPATPPYFEKEIQPILAATCYSCHGVEKKKAGLDLARFKTTASLSEGAELWATLVDRIKADEMPPGKAEKKLMPPDRDKLLKWLTGLPKAEVDCNKLATDESQNFYKGYVMSRRLARAEYNNTVRDLFGMDLKLTDMFPADGAGGEGFNNNGSALFISSIQIEKYLAAADKALNTVFPEKAPPKLSEQITAAQHRVMVATPGGNVSKKDAAASIVRNFARKAFRRPVKDEEVARILTMFERADSRGDSFVDSIKLALKSVLVSPNFLFLIEPEPEKEGVYRLGDFPLASRLSYFIWSSMPDDKLFELAEGGKLHDPEVYRAQIRRMIQDPKSKGLAENFATQWWGLDALNGSNRPDSKRFPEFDGELAEAMKNEAIMLFDSVFREDKPLTDFLDCKYTFVNKRLAAYYGLPPVEGNEMRRVTLSDRNRGGILGLGGVLTATSYPLRTSPVLRGKWVLEEVLGTKVPPPPPDAGQLPADDVKKDNMTFRQRLEVHRKKAECASCHQRMDPLGFGLENFDPIGRWRVAQAGEKVDAMGELPTGEKFNGPAELKEVLLKRKDEFIKNMTRKLLGYALGRDLTKYDTCVVKDSLKALSAGEYRSSILIEQIVMSYPFQYRYGKK